MHKPEDAIIFVNYRRADAGWPADHLATQLKTAFGQERVFLDVRGIEAGDNFTAELTRRLRQAGVLLVLIGPNWLFAQDKFGRRRLDHARDWVRREIHMALGKKDCRVIPVLLDDADLPNDEEALPVDIRALLKRQRIQVRQTHSEEDIATLIKALEKGGFPRPSSIAGQSELRKDEVITLTKSKRAVAGQLRRQIEVGEFLVEQLHESPASSQRQLDEGSRAWHSWRRYSEQLLRECFSTLQPLQRLTDLRPRHLEFARSWPERASELPQDVEQEVAYLKNLLIRLENYEGTKPSTSRGKPRTGGRRR